MDPASQPAWIEARTLDTETTRATWALAARHALADTAMEYHGILTVPDLASAVQRRSRIRTKQAPGLWMGDVLYRVAQECHGRGEPLLNSLCVSAEGFMDDWYADTVLTVRGVRVTDPEQHAAEERLECYRFHGAEMPAGGGVPALPPRRTALVRQPRTSSRTSSRAPRPARPQPPVEKLCPTCFMALPATGVCDNCD